MATFDFETQQASADWLTEVLAKNGYLTEGSVTQVEQTPSTIGGGASGTIYQLDLKYSAGSKGVRPTSFLMKIAMSGDTPGFDAITVRYAAWLSLPQSHRLSMLQKEPVFYEAVRNAETPLPLIECYGTASDTDNHRSCLLLEDISATHEQTPWPLPPDNENNQKTVSALARHHAHWWDSDKFGESDYPPVTLETVSEITSIYQDIYADFAAYMGDRLLNKRRAIYESALTALPNLLSKRMVDSDKLTLAHGDAHHWNMLLPKSDGDVIIFDWQTWHIDIGAYDLAYLMGVWWYPEHRANQEEKLLRHYLKEINDLGVAYEWDELVQDYQLAIVRHLFTPVVFSSFILPALWRNHLDRIFCTFEDWQCQRLLN